MLSGSDKPTFSVVFPCYNDAGTIAQAVRLAEIVCKKHASKFEIIVVDDGSQDDSRQVLIALKNSVPELQLVFHTANKGYGGALRSGFAKAQYQWLLYTDGDCQYDVLEMEKLISNMAPGIDVVNGYKTQRSDNLARKIIGFIYKRVCGMAFRLPIKDVDCDFRLIRTQLLHSVNLEYDSGAICVEMIKKLHLAGAKFTEVPVRHLPRTYGKSQFFKLKRILDVGFDLIRLWFKLFPFIKKSRHAVFE